MVERIIVNLNKIFLSLILVSLATCATSDTYRNPNMDFAAIRTVAVMPFDNLTRDKLAAVRARDVFSNILLSTGEIYVLPSGEVTRGILRTG